MSRDCTALEGSGDGLQIKAEIESRSAEDVNPPPSEAQQYMRSKMTLEGYKHLLAVGVCARPPDDPPLSWRAALPSHASAVLHDPCMHGGAHGLPLS